MTAFSELRWNQDGLIPAIVQDHETGQVLMMAWMNEQALYQTLIKGEAHFWSRSRQELWHKGAGSGNVQVVSDMFYDCDGDALLLRVWPQGPACHTGNTTCFFRRLDISLRTVSSPEDSPEAAEGGPEGPDQARSQSQLSGAATPEGTHL